MNLGPMEIGLIVLAILLLFGYKKLPDASRSLGRSLRIFKGEMRGLKDDDVRTKNAPITVPQLPAAEAEARAAEAHAAELRARADHAHAAHSRA
jgi:sec-independent protein translocase protein TatA